jgi:hypothetical protein
MKDVSDLRLQKLCDLQALVDRLLAMAETLEFNAERVEGPAALRLRGRAEGYKQAAWLLDELL